MSRRNVDLGSGSVGKLLFSLAVPTITSQIVNMLYNLVDRVYIGHMQPVETVGKLALTGVGVCLPIIMVISAFAALMAFGGAPRASIAEGRGDLKESERIMGNSFTMLVAVSVVLTVVFLVFAEPMLRIFGASDNTIGYALNYMRIYALGTIFVQVTLGMNAYITAQGFTVVGMKTVLIGAILNTVLDPIFIFALDLGTGGAALATILSQFLSFCLLHQCSNITVRITDICHQLLCLFLAGADLIYIRADIITCTCSHRLYFLLFGCTLCHQIIDLC